MSFCKIISKAFHIKSYAIIAVVALGLIITLIIITRSCSTEKKSDVTYRDYPAVVNSVNSVLKLATGEVYLQQTIVDTVNNMVMAMIVDSRSIISFDLEQMPQRVEGDTLYLELPPEIISHHETGLAVIDQYELGAQLFSKTITAEEENRIKEQIPDKLTELMYQEGYVQRARELAVQDIRSLVGSVFPYVVVTDHFPQGVRGQVFPDSIASLPMQQL